MENKEIVIKGTLDRLKIYSKPDISLQEMKAFLRRKFATGGFFGDIDYELALLDVGWQEEEKRELNRVLREVNPRLSLSFFSEDDDIPEGKLPRLKAVPMIVKKSFRSGQKVVAPGDIVIVGDINPGAEVVAGGDVLVFGRVGGGLLHAGASGENDAVIVALSLKPTQLRIGTIISRAPDQGEQREGGPEIARIKGKNIVIEKF